MSEMHIAACASSPNCVSSRSQDDAHYVRPLSFDATAEHAWDRLKLALTQEPRTSVIEERTSEWYLRAESTSFLFRFVDDLELQMVPEEKIIHVRSASRVGYWDLGVNRRRVERLRERFNGLLGKP